MTEHAGEQHEHGDPAADEPEGVTEHEQADDVEPEPTPAPEPSGALSEREMEKALKLLDKEATRHANRVSEIMGADANELLPCPLCVPAIPGFRFDAPMPPEQVEAVRLALGMAGEPEYAKAPDAQPCEACGALGQVLTGSLVPEHRLKLCSGCGGTGWQTPRPQDAGATGANGGGSPATAGAAAAVNGGEPDAWGRPAGHPHYGLVPALVSL